MTRKIALFAATIFAAVMFGNAAVAGGMPTPGKGHDRGHGHGKHYSSHYSSGYRYERREGYQRHRGHDRSRHRPYRHSRGPARIVRYSRYEVHHHGPGCGHRGYTRSRYRGYSHHGRYPYYGHGYRRDYGRAAFSGYDDGFGYHIEFDY